MLFERLNTYEGWEKEDISDWKKCCKDRLYEANGEELKKMHKSIDILKWFRVSKNEKNKAICFLREALKELED